ncbi:nitrogen permease regulator family protein [Schizosaccharomyces cryophilus OY26]|uniref:Nitrogen permease regulator family protein n=1 Tax=Schizosaccharomyces cryophilus (strain OY26 / ATCC MYA-4695 / CBS 11777 / NBRC 106824 / NRRL Y48691) TaxID=653667 RepID=S9W200_SCHCR|nr:nitrogen permease regulator family protein [Schizosaccharomyces cryophilus OY26]EPY52369.1 nitrogen permease regulator family protein [Schizosaccharomyces cryophilus OY26]
MEYSEEGWFDQADRFPPRLLAIFFAIFDPLQGPVVACEAPSGSVSYQDGGKSLLIPFENISDYVIPKRELCNKTITVCTNHYQVIGHPISILGSIYERNTLIFNMCMVFHEEEDSACYIPLVKRLARNLEVLEKQSHYISDAKKRSVIFSIIEEIFEDMNNFCECMIQLDDQNSINIKLFPSFPSPPAVKGFHVPILTAQLDLLMDKNWDMTVQKVYPFINGINSVQRIAELANVDYSSCLRCMEHFLYYGCLIIADIFQFHNIYAMTTNAADLLQDPVFQEECVSYVSFQGSSSKNVTFATIFRLYCSLRQGLRVKDWMNENREVFRGLDVRRLISFGTIKGLIYRVHKYPYLERKNTHKKITLEEERLLNMLDGTHHFDELCINFKKSPKVINEMISKLGDALFIYR